MTLEQYLRAEDIPVVQEVVDCLKEAGLDVYLVGSARRGDRKYNDIDLVVGPGLTQEQKAALEKSAERFGILYGSSAVLDNDAERINLYEANARSIDGPSKLEEVMERLEASGVDVESVKDTVKNQPGAYVLSRIVNRYEVRVNGTTVDVSFSFDPLSKSANPETEATRL